MKIFKQFIVLVLSLFAFQQSFCQSEFIEVWKGVKMPGSATDQPEKLQGNPKKDDHGYQFVSKPTLEFFAAKSKSVTGAVIICPGGGYGHLAYGKEGTEIAKFLSEQGINCFVLKYRIPQNRDGAFQDAQRALRLIRHNAAKWKIDRNKVGIMGFSAGGHLSARTSTNYAEESYKALDAADKLSAKPDFTVLIYPAYLANNNTYELSPEIHVDKESPMAFISHTQDDAPYIASSIGYYLALKKNKVSAELHIYSEGGHGYGFRIKDKPVSNWGNALVDWLKLKKLIIQ